MDKRKAMAGFSLIEVMVVVVIIGILSAFAFRSYTDHVIKSRRTDCQDMLLTVAQKMEKYFTFCNTYTDVVDGTYPATCPPEPGNAGLALTAAAPLLSPDGHYSISINPISTPPGITTSYQLTCTAITTAQGGTGMQMRDLDCRTMSFNSRNQKSATDSAAAAVPITRCWKN